MTAPAMQILPDYFYGFMPPGWWPDRPRNPSFYTLNTLPVPANLATGITVEQVFNKRKDCVVFGGVALVTDTLNSTVSTPTPGVWTQIMCKMRNPAGNITFSNGFVPFENMFAVWQNAGSLPVYWPMPVPIPKGGSLMMDLINLNVAGGDKNVRLTFLMGIIYDEADREPV
jgi:hypothetical protein